MCINDNSIGIKCSDFIINFITDTNLSTTHLSPSCDFSFYHGH